MARKRLFAFAVVVLASVVGFGCRNQKPGFCQHDSDCSSGMHCDLGVMGCVSSDGGIDGPGGNGGGGGHGGSGGAGCTANSCSGTAPVCDSTNKICRGCTTGECGGADGGTPVCAPSGRCVECGTDSDCTTATKPICDMTTNICRACTSGATECSGVSVATPACASSGACVACVTNTDCTTATKPICDGTNVCRACASDAECSGPGICVSDGHCATAAEVLFVDYGAGTCPGDGSSATPYCAFSGALPVLTAARRIMVLRGPAADRLTLNTNGVLPVVVGQKNSTGSGASVPAGPLTAVTVSSDTVLIRDLTLAGGTASGAKGIATIGTGTSVTLLRVTASLGTGLGVDAEAGTTLTMDECYAINNSAGGIQVNGASYSIQNTVIAANSVGVKFSAGAVSTGSQFWFNTVVGNSGSAISCDTSNAQTVSDSIVVGVDDSCTLTNSVTTMPALTSSYHLTAHLSCPTAPATFPSHDVGGDPRVPPIDCGADQFVP